MEKKYKIQEVLEIIEPLEREFFNTGREILKGIEENLEK